MNAALNLLFDYRHHRTVPFIDGPYQAVISGLIDVDFLQTSQIQSFGFVQRVDLTTSGPIATVGFETAIDYYYLMYGFRAFYPDAPGPAPSPTLFYQFVTVHNDREYEDRPTAIRTVTTPGNNERTFYMEHLRRLIFPAGRFQFRITGHDGTDPEYVEIITQGFLIPTAILKP